MVATAKEAEMAEATEAGAEMAAIMEAEAVKIAAGMAVSKRKIARILNPAITACPDCYFYLGSHKASECPNCSASVTAPATSNSQHGGFLGSIHTNLGVGLLVTTSARPALAARARAA